MKSSMLDSGPLEHVCICEYGNHRTVGVKKDSCSCQAGAKVHSGDSIWAAPVQFSLFLSFCGVEVGT